MANGEVDPLDLAAFPFFTIGSLITFGIWEPGTISGWDPTSTLIELGPETVITAPNLVVLASLAAMLYTNRPRFNPYSLSYTWITVVTAMLVLSEPFVPLISNMTNSSTFAGIVLFVITGFGYAVASWLG